MISKLIEQKYGLAQRKSRSTYPGTSPVPTSSARMINIFGLLLLSSPFIGAAKRVKRTTNKAIMNKNGSIRKRQKTLVELYDAKYYSGV